MKLSVLGCSGGIGAGLNTTSMLLNDDVLIDSGTGICVLPHEQLRHIRHIFITHSHLDHIGGIPLLVDTLFEELVEPLNLYSQEATINALRKHIFNNTIWPDFSVIPTADKGVMAYHVLEPGSVKGMGGFSIEMIKVSHIVPAVGYRVETVAGTSIAFSGDTATNDSFWEALNRHDNLDVLIVECGFPNRDRELSELAKHYCPETLAADLKKLNHKPKIYLTHLKPEAEDETFAECQQALTGFELVRLNGGDILEFD